MGKSSDTFSIRQVVDLTGLSEFTLRGWENRYKAFRPRRSSTGRRSYSDKDLQKAILLRELIARDFRIGHIAQLSNLELEALLQQKAEEAASHGGPFHKEIEKLLRDLSLQNWDDIETRLRKIIHAEKPKTVLKELVVPLVSELGRMVASGIVSISQEHIFSSILKEALYLLREAAPRSQSRKRFLVASPEGDYHELGILIAHTMLAHAGYKSLYIGPNTPKKDLCETAMRFGATHILMGSTVSRREGAREDLYSYLHFVEQNLSEENEIWLAGRNTNGPPVRFER
ncbi:MAG: MerR family transcriptional regulator, partial [Pseudobdellovibrionaceae bacterium]